MSTRFVATNGNEPCARWCNRVLNLLMISFCRVSSAHNCSSCLAHISFRVFSHYLATIHARRMFDEIYGLTRHTRRMILCAFFFVFISECSILLLHVTMNYLRISMSIYNWIRSVWRCSPYHASAGRGNIPFARCTRSSDENDILGDCNGMSAVSNHLSIKTEWMQQRLDSANNTNVRRRAIVIGVCTGCAKQNESRWTSRAEASKENNVKTQKRTRCAARLD